MCELMKKLIHETAIITTINNYREFNLTDDEILARITKKFNLSDKEARKYISK